MADTGRRRTAVVVGITVVLALATGAGSYNVGRSLSDPEPNRPTTATPSPGVVRSPPGAPSAVASPSPPVPSELSEVSRSLAKRAAVRLSDPEERYHGSGSLISADGLILTNAHVARPTAPGLALAYGEDVWYGEVPSRLVVSVSPPGDGPAVPTYLAEVLAVDGYLDLAVLKVVGSAQGGPLPPGTTFPFMPRGRVADLDLGDDLTVYGFPAVTGGEALSVSPGSVRTFLPDQRRRATQERFNVETTAEFSGGNSGGMALDNAGRLVGVPSSTRAEVDEPAVARFVRAVDLAEPLIASVTSGKPYVPALLLRSSGRESARDLLWTQDDELPCRTQGAAAIDSSFSGLAASRILLTGLDEGQEVLQVVQRDGVVLRRTASAWKSGPSATCLRTVVTEAELSGNAGTALVDGTYELLVYVGVDQRLVVRSTATVIGSDEIGD